MDDKPFIHHYTTVRYETGGPIAEMLFADAPTKEDAKRFLHFSIRCPQPPPGARFWEFEKEVLRQLRNALDAEIQQSLRTLDQEL